MNRKILVATCLAIGIGYFVVGLWPFSLHVHNNLVWQPGEEGTYFAWLSVVYSEGRIVLGEGTPSSDQSVGTTVELYLVSGHRSTGEVGSILSLYDGELPSNLVIAQWRSEILLRAGLWDERGRRSYHELGADIDMHRGDRRLIVMTSDALGTSFYADGVLAKAYPGLALRPEGVGGRLIVGDAPEGGQNWTGKLIGMAMFSRSLAAPEISRHYGLWKEGRARELSGEPRLAALYFFGERAGGTIPDHSGAPNPLLVPEHYRTFSKTILVPPWRDPHPYFSDAGDVLTNVLGFVPFGFFYFIYRRQSQPGRTSLNLGMTAVVSGVISVAIELIQIYLPTRTSSLTDVICNIVGALAGAVFVAVALSVIEKRAARRIWTG